MLRKLSDCNKNCFYAKRYTSRAHIPKIVVSFSEMASPDQIWYRGSLTTPLSQKIQETNLNGEQAKMNMVRGI